MGFFERTRRLGATRRFHKQHPEWLRERTSPSAIESAFDQHPGWRAVSVDFRSELALRIYTARVRFYSFDSTHAFEAVAGMTALLDVLEQNIIPIDRNPSHSIPDKCWLVAETFRKLGAKGIQSALAAGPRAESQKIANGLTTSVLCLEAAISFNHYKFDALGTVAMGWVYRNSDFDRAREILSEALDLASAAESETFHSLGDFDEATINMLDDIKAELSQSMQRLDAMEQS